MPPVMFLMMALFNFSLLCPVFLHRYVCLLEVVVSCDMAVLITNISIGDTGIALACGVQRRF